MACYADSYFTCQKKSFNAVSSFNFQIKRNYKNETLLNGVYSRTNVPRNIKDGEDVINLTKYDKSHHIELFAMFAILDDPMIIQSLGLRLGPKAWPDQGLIPEPLDPELKQQPSG